MYVLEPPKGALSGTWQAYLSGTSVWPSKPQFLSKLHKYDDF
jgi:hypothetical protein